MQACLMGWLQLLDVEAVPFLVAVLRSPSLWPGALPTFSEKPGAESLGSLRLTALPGVPGCGGQLCPCMSCCGWGHRPFCKFT